MAMSSNSNPTTLTLEERFWAKVDKTPGQGRNGDCWAWIGAKNKRGYGIFNKGKTALKKSVVLPAHRMAYEIHMGVSAADLLVCHKCDNPSCVNPEHFFLGTHKDNAQDMSAKGRSAQQQITHCPSGHMYNDENTRFYKSQRVCRMCDRLRARKRYSYSITGADLAE